MNTRKPSKCLTKKIQNNMTEQEKKELAQAMWYIRHPRQMKNKFQTNPIGKDYFDEIFDKT